MIHEAGMGAMAIALSLFLPCLAPGQTGKTAESLATSEPAELQESRRPAAAEPNRAGAAQPEFKVAFWFARKNAIGTFKYQVYDLRKGQYTPAVDQWQKKLAAEFPHYEAYVKDLYLAKQEGRTEQEKVAAAISRELYVTSIYYAGVPWEAVVGRPALPGQPFGLGAGVSGRAEGGRLHPLPPMFPSPGEGRPSAFSNPSPYSFPNPYPYPRPHP